MDDHKLLSSHLPAEDTTGQQTPHLPDELLIQILTHLPNTALWHTIRHLNRTLRAEAEKLLLTTFFPTLSLSLTYTLGSGTSHRWYDVRATISLSFTSTNRHNPDFALFEVSAVHPPNYYERALEKWRPMCARGLGAGLDWMVSCEGVTHRVCLAKLVLGEDGSVWCDWQELVGKWFRKEEEMATKYQNTSSRERLLLT